ncbi:MAG: hypothetical protein BMS9Abin28_0736 [Anaerolineae bacterium]|nr:MAG: hypothetical protein BMS9Abin28_0736 [Anaerolineae bacterium]
MTQIDAAPLRRRYTIEIILIGVLLLAAALRLVGIGWDRQTHMHPDERFLTMVETSLQFPDSIGQYFDTATSPFNPNNVGHTFFVYGTLPIFLVRIIGEWISQTGYDQIYIVGRAASAVFDTVSVYLIYLIGARLYSRRVGLLAAAFTATSVLLIQHAHFFVVDTFANTFILIGIYFAVRAMDEGKLLHYVLFGAALGMAVASKISAVPLAGVIILASIVRLWGQGERPAWTHELGRLVLAALVSLLTFRVFQPYAFSGVGLNPLWLDSLGQVNSLASGEADVPFVWQWAQRIPLLFAFRNLVSYGMGVPLGILAWAGWGWALIRTLRGDWQRHLIPLVWTGAYFLWRGSGFTSAMRYQLPIYPTLALFASWAFWEAWERARDLRIRERLPVRWLVGGVGAFVLLATFVYAVAFAANYVRPFTRYEASSWIYQNVPSPVNLVLNDERLEPIPYPGQLVLDAGDPTELTFRNRFDGEVTSIYLPYVSGPSGAATSLMVSLSDNSGQLASGQYAGTLAADGESRIEVRFDRPVTIEADKDYSLRLQPGFGQSLSLRGSVLITETSWDDALPLPIEGRNGFAGIYTGVNQELYWPDDEDKEANGIPDKLERIVSTLTEGDYLVITSSRQYGSVGRLPQRWPLTVAYYRALFDCPNGVAVEVCAAAAEPGEVQGKLGYELIATFERNPRIGPFEFKDQLAEEPFTVYDHPKVLIFAKQPGFDPEDVQARLASVDVSRVQNLPPNEIGSVPPDLLLTEEQLEIQQAGGTWSELFSRESLINRSQPLGVVAWWLILGVLGLLAFPLVRTAFPGLRDGGYPLSKLVALLFIAWASWMAASLGLRYTRGTILLMVLLLAAVSAALAWRDREALLALFRERRREILFIEALALGFFLFDLAIRIGNPDLWHRYLGGEKPMDFSYLNAVLRSSTFPPYDPWYAGGYINYYYFGFVLVGTPIKLLGLIPSVAYNLVLPTLFSLSALAAYAVGTNLVARAGKAYDAVRAVSPRVAGLAAALALVVLGNLGTVRLIYGALEEVGARGGDGTSLGVADAAVGLGRVLSQQDRLPIGLNNWYWEPSRAIAAGPGEAGPITEFPFFTFLYADLHAHMISLPLTVLALAWAISWVLAADKGIALRWVDRILAIGMGALTIGVLAPTNTWDFPVYWTLGALAVAAAPVIRERGFTLRAAVEAVVSAAVLLLLANLLFRPYYIWYGAGYTEVDLWQGSRTSIDSYVTVHGLFLVVLLPWLAWETRQWMAATPLSSLSRIRPYFGLIIAVVLASAIAVAFLTADGFSIAPLVALVFVWSGALVLRRNFPIEKRIALVMVGTAAALTFLVEAVVLVGDIGRMNTVFKFYLQVWTLFTMAGSAALVWLLADLPAWGPRARWAWSAVFAAALFGAALYPLTATFAKIRDRMTPLTPISLDGMAFMKEAIYDDLGQQISLAGDYEAIQWMQENVKGSPVIVEAQIPEYRWGSRFSIYTGLPTVLGWSWHQRQQRAVVESLDVPTRAEDISSFYVTPSPSEAIDFLSQYDVRYIVVGELEKLYYESFDQCQPIDGGGRVTCDMSGRLVGQRTLDVPASQCEMLGSALACPTGGIKKFEVMESLGILRAVYRNGSTTIYEVLT